MITTEANAVVAPIHQRMPAVLEPEQLAAYLGGEIATFAPLAGSLHRERHFNRKVDLNRQLKPLQAELEALSRPDNPTQL